MQSSPMTRAAPDDHVRVDGGARADRRAGLDHDERTDRHVRGNHGIGRDRAEPVDSSRWLVALREQPDRLREGCVRIAAAQQGAGGVRTGMVVERFADDDRGGARGGELREVLRVGDEGEIARRRPCSIDAIRRISTSPSPSRRHPQAFGEFAKLHGENHQDCLWRRQNAPTALPSASTKLTPARYCGPRWDGISKNAQATAALKRSAP